MSSSKALKTAVSKDVRVEKGSGEFSVDFSQDQEFGLGNTACYTLDTRQNTISIMPWVYNGLFTTTFRAKTASIDVKEGWKRPLNDPRRAGDQIIGRVTVSASNCTIQQFEMLPDGIFSIILAVEPGMSCGVVKLDPPPKRLTTFQPHMLCSKLQDFGLEKIRFARLRFYEAAKNNLLDVPSIRAILSAESRVSQADAMVSFHQRREETLGLDIDDDQPDLSKFITEFQMWDADKKLLGQKLVAEFRQTQTKLQAIELLYKYVTIEGGFTVDEVKHLCHYDTLLQQVHKAI